MRRRPGYMLIEIIVVMVVLTLVISLSSFVILGMLRTYAVDAGFAQRLVAQEQIAELFRTDAASAGTAPLRAGRFTASSSCMILRRGDDTLVVYEATPAGLERIEQSAATESRRLLPLESDQARIAFSRGAPEDRLLTLRWIETRGSEGALVEHVLEFSAALGGDLR